MIFTPTLERVVVCRRTPDAARIRTVWRTLGHEGGPPWLVPSLVVLAYMLLVFAAEEKPVPTCANVVAPLKPMLVSTRLARILVCVTGLGCSAAATDEPMRHTAADSEKGTAAAPAAQAPAPPADAASMQAPDATVPADLLGVFHLVEPTALEAYNLRIHERGAFRWSLNGCDFFGGDRGRAVSSDVNTVTLLADHGEDTFSWVLADVVVSTVTARVTLNAVAPGVIRAEFDGRQQTWMSGAICPPCGPTQTELYPCPAAAEDLDL